MRAIAAHVAWSASLCVCLLITSMHHAKAGEPIEMPFKSKILLALETMYYIGRARIPHRRRHMTLWGGNNTWACPLSAVDIINILSVVRKTAAAMRLLAIRVLYSDPFLPARRYTNEGTSYGTVSVSLSVCLSVTTQSSIETDERIELDFGMGASFHLYHTLC